MMSTVHVAVTEHPTAAWTAQPPHNALSETERRDIFSTIVIRLCRRGNHHRRNEHTDGSNRAAIAVAERLRGTHHRFVPTRVPRPCHRGQRRRV